jgi:putative Ca2+/H+ antiporter (TMEM165/GDT1 family)
MEWLRSKAKRLSLLALFALAMQIGLSFGHTHVAAWFGDRTQIATAAPASGGTSDHHDAADAICAICVTTAMAASGLHTAAPVLPLPVRFAAVDFVSSLSTDAPRFRTAAFHSRGPPLLLT